MSITIVTQSARHFKAKGFLSKAEIVDKLGHVQPAVKSRILSVLCNPSVIVSGVALFAPDVFEPIIARYCPHHAFNRMARDFICGRYAPSSTYVKSKPRRSYAHSNR